MRDDESVYGYRPGGPADQGVDVQRVQGVAELAGEGGQARDRRGDAVQVGRGLRVAASVSPPPPAG